VKWRSRWLGRFSSIGWAREAPSPSIDRPTSVETKRAGVADYGRALHACSRVRVDRWFSICYLRLCFYRESCPCLHEPLESLASYENCLIQKIYENIRTIMIHLNIYDEKNVS
jgi:hypothetical protein